MNLVIFTQCMENYGYTWKYKGGNSYILENVPLNDVNYQELADKIAEQVSYTNEMFREYLIQWEIHDKDFISIDEQNQLDYDGYIMYFDKRVDYQDFITGAMKFTSGCEVVYP